MLISKFRKNNQLMLSLKRSASTKSKNSHYSRKLLLDSPLESFLSPSTTSEASQPPQSTTSPTHPVSTSLFELQSSRTPFSTAQAMNRAIQKVIINAPPQPSSSKDPPSSYRPSSSLPTESTQQNRAWNQIYIQFLISSSSPTEFAHRIGDLVNKRLPKKSIEEMLKLHSSQNHLISVDSYNQLIEYSYKSEKYHQARSLINEMKERGIEKNQKTLELIACSYQALNKSKGVELTLKAIKSDASRLSSQGLTTLFSIRPRRSSRLQHFDSMDDPRTSKPDKSSSSSENLEYQKWMLIDEFLKSHNWDLENLRTDCRALVTVTKRLMETRRWNEARQFVDLILKLDHRISTLDQSLPAINSYWSTSLLEALVFGLYNLKRETIKSKKKVTGDNNLSTVNLDEALNENEVMNDEDDNRRNDYLSDLGIKSVFEFVESFVDQNRSHKIKLNTKILLNCLRIETSLAPSEIRRLIKNWTHRYGLDPNQMGSRIGIRLLHVFSAWFISQIRSIKILLQQHLDHPASSSSTSTIESVNLKNYIRSKTSKLVQEYLVIDQDFLVCLKNTKASSSNNKGQKEEDNDDQEMKELKMIERMVLNGPIDGKFIQSNYRFISFQDVKSIHLSVKKIFKIHSKIQNLLEEPFLLLNNDQCSMKNDQGQLLLLDDDSGFLDHFMEPIQFKSRFYRLIHALKNQINPYNNHQQNNLKLTPTISSSINSKTLDPKNTNHTHFNNPNQSLVSINNNNKSKEQFIKFQLENNFIVCWSSENLNSPPIYLKPPS